MARRPIHRCAWNKNSRKFAVASYSSRRLQPLDNRPCCSPPAPKRSELVAVVAPMCIKGLRLVTVQLPEKFLPIGVGTNRSSHNRVSTKFALNPYEGPLFFPSSPAVLSYVRPEAWRGSSYIRKAGSSLCVFPILPAAGIVFEPVFECWSIGRLVASEDLSVGHDGVFYDCPLKVEDNQVSPPQGSSRQVSLT